MVSDSKKKISLSGFNNLTKVLSFNLYDFCITLNEQQKLDYIEYINEKYSAQKIEHITSEVCSIIDAKILNATCQDYEPVGASTMLLMSDETGSGWEKNFKKTSQVAMHLDKSHITAHTYPDAQDPEGICSFRVDIDIATCGEIVPLSAINFLFESFECDVVFIDYVVRGFTRLADGTKIYNDHKVNSIQDYINPRILEDYVYRFDINISHDNIWQTKLMIREMGPERYLMEPQDVNHPEVPNKMKLLNSEMREVFHLQ